MFSYIVLVYKDKSRNKTFIEDWIWWKRKKTYRIDVVDGAVVVWWLYPASLQAHASADNSNELAQTRTGKMLANFLALSLFQIFLWIHVDLFTLADASEFLSKHRLVLMQWYH